MYIIVTVLYFMYIHFLMVGVVWNRYDIRNRLEDKAQFGLKPILPRRRTEDEDEFEERLDQERYLALGVDILEHELLEGNIYSI